MAETAPACPRFGRDSVLQRPDGVSASEATVAPGLHRFGDAPDGGGTLIEGVVDLAFREAGAWTVVDFKTDHELDAELDRYRRQVALYAELVARATGEQATPLLLRI